MKYAVCLSVIICSAIQYSSGAVELAVPGKYATIQQALDAAQPGDEIKIQAGQYEGPLMFKDGISLAGVGTKQVVVRCAADVGPVLTAKGCASGRIAGIAFEQTPRKTPLAPYAKDSVVPACLIEASTLEITECEARNAEGFGFKLVGKGSTVLRSCVARKNAQSGIWVVGPEAAPRLVKDVCSENGHSGILLWTNTDARVEDSACKANLWSGIYAVGPECKLVLRHNECSANGASGIFLDQGVQGTLEENRLNENKLTGLYLRGETTEAKLTSNTFRGNARAALCGFAGPKVRGSKNNFSGNGEVGEEAQFLFEDEDFAALEKLAGEARKEALTRPAGALALNRLYSNIVFPCGRPAADAKLLLERLDRWKKAYPESIAWRIALARTYSMLAGLEESSEYLDKARNALEEAKHLEPTDPEYYTLRVMVMLQTGPSGASANKFQHAFESPAPESVAPVEDFSAAVFEEGREKAPFYVPLYAVRIQTLMPEFSGRSPHTIVALVDDVATKTSSTYGDAMYAELACVTCNLAERETFAANFSFDWARLERGFEDLAKQCSIPGRYDTLHCLLACLYGKRDVAKGLFERLGGQPDENIWGDNRRYEAWRSWAAGSGAPPEFGDFEAAVRECNVERVQALLKEGARTKWTSAEGKSLLRLASDEACADVLRLLIENGADVNLREEDNGSTPLMCAVDSDTPDCLKVLLEHKADPNARGSTGWTPLLLAVNRKKADCADILLEHGADVNATLPPDGYNPLMLAATDGTDEVVKVLLRYKANPNAQSTDYGLTALMQACRFKHLSTVNLLLEGGADPNVAKPNGAVPLFDAAEKAGNLEMAKALLAKGANVNARTKGGWNAFHAAVRGNAKDVLEYFLQLNPDGVKMTTQSGKTLLHEASQKGNVEIVKLLLEKNAIDVNAIDKEGNRTALANAREAKSDEIVALLQAKGAKE